LAAGAVSYMVLAHYRGRPIHWIFKRTKENLDKLGNLKKNIPQYSPTIYLPSSYLKTLSTYAIMRNPFYRREIIRAFGNGHVALDHFPGVPKECLLQREKRPLVLIIPGFGTDSYSQYIYDCATELHQELGWDVTVFNQKGMGKLPFKGDDILGYWNVKDLEMALQHLAKEYDDIHLVGFSVGANLIQTYLTDVWDLSKESELHKKTLLKMKSENSDYNHISMKQLLEKYKLKTDRPFFRDVEDTSIISKICSSVCVSPIYHFQTTCNLISSKPWVNPVLNGKFFSYLDYNLQFDEFKSALSKANIDPADLKKIKSFTQLNQAIIQGAMNENDPQRAFDQISPWAHLKNMRTKMLCISSLDDPIVDNYHLPIEGALSNENLWIALVTSGGHISYSHGIKNDNWSVLVAVEYLRQMQELRKPGSSGPYPAYPEVHTAGKLRPPTKDTAEYFRKIANLWK
jgi:predicted alpha/beta-fold hydrolase